MNYLVQKNGQHIIKEEPKEVCDAIEMKVDMFTAKTNMEIAISIKFWRNDLPQNFWYFISFFIL